MTDYIVIIKIEYQEFIDAVNNKLKEGYIPIGGVFCRNEVVIYNKFAIHDEKYSLSGTYLQAMIKKRTKKGDKNV